MDRKEQLEKDLDELAAIIQGQRNEFLEWVQERRDEAQVLSKSLDEGDYLDPHRPHVDDDWCAFCYDYDENAMWDVPEHRRIKRLGYCPHCYREMPPIHEDDDDE